jgi:hypothetical protein
LPGSIGTAIAISFFIVISFKGYKKLTLLR